MIDPAALRALPDQLRKRADPGGCTQNQCPDHVRHAPCPEFWGDKRNQWCRTCVELEAAAALTALLDERESHADLRNLASAMRKLLPPKVLREVLGYIDPLGTFKRVLEGETR